MLAALSGDVHGQCLGGGWAQAVVFAGRGILEASGSCVVRSAAAVGQRTVVVVRWPGG